MQVRWAGDRCTVCDSDVDFDYDQLVSCDQCGITVHQTCYGVPELPGEDDLWLCRSCEFKVISVVMHAFLVDICYRLSANHLPQTSSFNKSLS